MRTLKNAQCCRDVDKMQLEERAVIRLVCSPSDLADL
jgi:hypothetical protein